ncbi:MAG TPA: hypothetical protein VKB51_17615 [bacterium]|nr:hypothetical protein [bacterium]
MTHIPEAYRSALQGAIEAVTETKAMLGEVAQRFGTADPEALQARIGEACSDTVIDESTVTALRALLATHEVRREACRLLMEDAANGRALSTDELGGTR